jgi:hypothetical protein
MIGLFAKAVTEPASDLEIWLRFFGIVASVIGSIAVACLALMRKQDKLDNKMDRVQQLSEPTGNGFAKDMRESLLRVETNQALAREEQKQLTSRFDRHLEHHIDKESK